MKTLRNIALSVGLVTVLFACETPKSDATSTPESTVTETPSTPAEEPKANDTSAVKSEEGTPKTEAATPAESKEEVKK
ncbi:MAG: hypothetical protein RLZZ175_3206 [Bacteroidota bacterium]|jgi:hypothetical protein